MATIKPCWDNLLGILAWAGSDGSQGTPDATAAILEEEKERR
jgi:hypothetical protein